MSQTEHTCPTCGAWFMNEPDWQECATCGEPCCPKCVATCESCARAIHQQLPALGNQQCMFAFEDRDPDTGGASYLLICGACDPAVALAKQQERSREGEAERIARWARDLGDVA